jgi:hypothetical protein
MNASRFHRQWLTTGLSALLALAALPPAMLPAYHAHGGAVHAHAGGGAEHAHGGGFDHAHREAPVPAADCPANTAHRREHHLIQPEDIRARMVHPAAPETEAPVREEHVPAPSTPPRAPESDTSHASLTAHAFLAAPPLPAAAPGEALPFSTPEPEPLQTARTESPASPRGPPAHTQA